MIRLTRKGRAAIARLRASRHQIWGFRAQFPRDLASLVARFLGRRREALPQRREIGGQGRAIAHGFAGDRMLETEQIGVQGLPAEVCQGFAGRFGEKR